MMLHLVQQFGRIVGDLQVVAGDLPFLDHRTRAPAFAVNHLFVGQHRLVHRVPIHNLGFAIGNAFFKHF